MPITLLAARTDLRSRLNETGVALFTDADLNTWLNEGARDMARKTRCLWGKTSVPIYEGQGQYSAPGDFLEFHRAEYLPDSSINVYPLEFHNYSEMDSIWGINQHIQQFYCKYLTLWKEPPNTYFVLFPVPSAPGSMNVQYFRNPEAATADAMNLDVPEGWWDLAIVYGLYTALFKGFDPRWKDMRQLYNEQLQELAATASGWSDNLGQMSYGTPSNALWPFGGMGGELWG